MTWIKERIREVELFDEEELRQAAKHKNKKAAGCDGVPAEAIKVMVEEVGQRVLEVMNKLYRTGRFPELWKTASISYKHIGEII